MLSKTVLVVCQNSCIASKVNEYFDYVKGGWDSNNCFTYILMLHFKHFTCITGCHVTHLKLHPYITDVAQLSM